MVVVVEVVGGWNGVHVASAALGAWHLGPRFCGSAELAGLAS